VAALTSFAKKCCNERPIVRRDEHGAALARSGSATSKASQAQIPRLPISCRRCLEAEALMPRILLVPAPLKLCAHERSLAFAILLPSVLYPRHFWFVGRAVNRHTKHYGHNAG
jgi:hypothetical protein